MSEASSLFERPDFMDFSDEGQKAVRAYYIKTKKPLRVWYGVTKINKIVKHREFAVYYEDGYNNPSKNLEWIKRRIVIAHTRNQSDKEQMAGWSNNRMFMKYSYRLDKFGGDEEKALHHMFINEADMKTMSAEDIENVKALLRKAYFSTYNCNPYSGQKSLNLN